MALLGGFAYDPATQVIGTSGLSAMTAVDTTNCRATFTAPASGNVLVRIKTAVGGGTSGGTNAYLFGVLEGATVVARQSPIGGKAQAVASGRIVMVSEFAVTGVSAGSHSWDLAVAQQQVAAASGIIYGGPNDTTTTNSTGAISMEVWDAPNLLVAKNYDPAAMVSKSTGSLLAMTALDTTNLRATFTAPASGNILVIVRGTWVAPSTSTTVTTQLGVLEGATVIARGVGYGGHPSGTAIAANGFETHEVSQIVMGISAGSHTYDAAYGVDLNLASSNYKYGGPNDATGADAAGMLRFEIWSA